MAREVITLYTLFIDTHNKNVLIILYKDGKVLEYEDLVTTNKHSEVAMPTIEKVLTSSSIDVKDLDSIIVVNGPGSFTGERIAVTIGKTISYCLNIPIRVIDALTINAININSEVKITALEDRTGAYIGKFDANNKKLEQFQYMNKTLYNEFKDNNDVVVDVNIDYEKVYEYIMTLESLNPHEVKPLYIKGISALNDK